MRGFAYVKPVLKYGLGGLYFGAAHLLGAVGGGFVSGCNGMALAEMATWPPAPGEGEEPLDQLEYPRWRAAVVAVGGLGGVGAAVAAYKGMARVTGVKRCVLGFFAALAGGLLGFDAAGSVARHQAWAWFGRA